MAEKKINEKDEEYNTCLSEVSDSVSDTSSSEESEDDNIEISYEKDKEYLKNYLESIKNKNNKYKRVIISPLRYPGGKSNAIGLILENLPRLKNKKIISVFFGGGSFELCISQYLGIEVIGYDIFNLLINFWNVLINNKEEFIKELKKFKITKEEFTYNRHVLLNHWNKIKPSTLKYKTNKKVELKKKDLTLLENNKIQQAVYYYYNMSLSYGPMFLGWPSNHEINYNKFQRRINRIDKLNIKNLKVYCEDFKSVIPKHKNDFLFLDPPYYLEGDSKMFKGLYPNCNFPIHHNNFDHEYLFKLLKDHKSGFLLTYNNCSFIKKLYSDYTIKYPTWQYTYGQGEKRIGKNRITNSNKKESHEIFIISYPQIY